jgi:hypothetical protein
MGIGAVFLTGSLTVNGTVTLFQNFQITSTSPCVIINNALNLMDNCTLLNGGTTGSTVTYATGSLESSGAANDLLALHADGSSPNVDTCRITGQVLVDNTGNLEIRNSTISPRSATIPAVQVGITGGAGILEISNCNVGPVGADWANNAAPIGNLLYGQISTLGVAGATIAGNGGTNQEAA